MITLADVMCSASDAREVVNVLREHIDAHESFAERNPEYGVQTRKDLQSLAQDIKCLSWVMSENRQAMIRDREREKEKAAQELSARSSMVG